MAIEFNCSKCGERVVVAGTLAGKSLRCRACGAIIRVPADSPANTAPPTTSPAMPPQPDQTPTAPGGSVDHDHDHVHASLTAAADRDTPRDSVSVPPLRKSPWPAVLVVIAVIGAVVGIWLANRGGHETTGPAVAPTARLNTLTLAQTAPEPAYQQLVNCWLSELTIRDPETARQVTLWVYLPLLKKGAPRSIGCVFVAAGGPGSLPGSRLSEDQREEHLALVKADFAVVAYDVEGALPKANAVGPAAVASLVQFMAADGGLADARLAVEYAQCHIPEVDPLRFYAAGSGSSGTIALLLAASDPYIRGCAVRAPVVDLVTPLAPYKDRLNEMVQDASSFLVEHSPYSRIASVANPVWVFHAEDDTDVAPAESARLSQASDKVTLDAHAAVGDAANRVQIGRTRAIAWLVLLDDKVSGGMRSAPPPATRPALPLTQPATQPAAATQPDQPPARVDVIPQPTTQPDTRPVTMPATQPALLPATLPTTLPTTQPDSERPSLVPPPIDPMRQRISDAAARLINLGATVRLDPTALAQTSLLDLRDISDTAKAAQHIPALGKVAMVHLTAQQTTPALIASLKSLPSIALLNMTVTGLTDAHMEQIGTLTNVEELSLMQASIGPDGIKAMAGMTGLKKLNLRAAKISDAACAQLDKLASLKTLDLSDTAVTGEGIARLKDLKNLVTLRLKNTQVDQAAIDDLRTALPRLNIIPP